MRRFAGILSTFLVCLAMMLGAGCRALRTREVTRSRERLELAEVEYHRLDSLAHSTAERQTIIIEYYNPYENVVDQDSPELSRPTTAATSDSTLARGCGGVVKRIEITTERVDNTQQKTQVDSTAETKSADNDLTEKKQYSETRPDNGTWIGIAIVAAVALLFYAFLKNHIKK